MSREKKGIPLRGLLSLVDAMGGQLESRIRLQKAVYLLKMAGVLDFRDTSFRYHHYGPYSRPLSDTLQDAVVAGLLEEKRAEYGEDMSRYTYVLTDSGREWLEENGESGEARLREMVPQLGNDVPWRNLELAATILFLEKDENLSRGAATERALQLKPPCAEHRDSAQRLLQSVGL